MNSHENSSRQAQSIQFSLSLSAEKYKAYYQGQVYYIQVQSHDGRSIRFPASAIRRFLTTEGIYGEFEILVDQNNKLIEVRKR